TASVLRTTWFATVAALVALSFVIISHHFEFVFPLANSGYRCCNRKEAVRFLQIMVRCGWQAGSWLLRS
ncbi:MAG TPA: hypothetical protein VKG92_07285, partial [Flavobacteriales bacterium]|nr:hypothetical protein [Flavobacteriales bacterium]